jgi:hypothetical protein
VVGCEAQPCVRQSDCRSGLVCQVGVCTAPPADAGADAGDVGFDAPELRDAPRIDALDAPAPLDGGDAPPEADAGPLDGGLDASADLDAAGLDAPDAAELDAP